MVARGTWNNCSFLLRSCFLSCKSVKVRPLIPKRTGLCLNIGHFSPTDTCFRARVLEYWTQLGVGGFEAEKEKGVTSESWAGTACSSVVAAVTVRVHVKDTLLLLLPHVVGLHSFVRVCLPWLLLSLFRFLLHGSHSIDESVKALPEQDARGCLRDPSCVGSLRSIHELLAVDDEELL
ncbi:hypothetical protein NC651_034636 [Populus alba x Populus x berolinensis]|nr:hypothetical protein NC651_034636 [Populus alba x Populus x berolinensis]